MSAACPVGERRRSLICSPRRWPRAISEATRAVLPAVSINALAQAVGLDYRRVHDDVEALVTAGLVDREEGGTGLTAPYDAIATRIAL